MEVGRQLLQREREREREGEEKEIAEGIDKGRVKPKV